jgi:hypothetical protein
MKDVENVTEEHPPNPDGRELFPSRAAALYNSGVHDPKNDSPDDFVQQETPRFRRQHVSAARQNREAQTHLPAKLVAFHVNLLAEAFAVLDRIGKAEDKMAIVARQNRTPTIG